MKSSLYILNTGELKKKDKTLQFVSKEYKKYYPIENIQEIFIMGNIRLNNSLIEFLSYKSIPVHFFNYYNRYVGTFYPLEKNTNSNALIEQLLTYNNKDNRLEIAKYIIVKTINNILQNIFLYKRNNKEMLHSMMVIKAYKNNIVESSNINQIMAYEGISRKIYYRCFNYILCNNNFYFYKRTRRPPKDPLNALISFGNTLLYADTLNEIFKTHLDPRIGFLHTANNRKFTLNIDIAEIFKPLVVDRIIFKLVNKGQIKIEHFRSHKNGIYLTKEGVKIFLSEYDMKINKVNSDKKNDRENSYRTRIRKECYKLEELFHKFQLVKVA